MPIARTPPPQSTVQAPAQTPRPNTFSPSQAYPDPAFRTNAKLMYTPPGGAPGQPASPQAEPGVEAEGEPSKQDEEMDVEAELEAPVPDEAMAVDEPHVPTKPAPIEPAPTEPASTEPAPILPAPTEVPDAPEAPAAPAPPAAPTPKHKAPRKSAPPPADSPTQERSPRSRLKRVRQSFAAGIIPPAIPIEPEEPEVSVPEVPQPEPQQPEAEHRPAEPTPQPAAEAGPSRRASRRSHRERTPAEVLAEPAVKIPDVGEAEFGKYYEALVGTLRNQVVDRGLSRLTLEQMKECYPRLAASKPEMFENVWASLLHDLRQKTLEGAMSVFDDYRITRRMRRFADMIDEARVWAAEHPGEGRRDAWRPDLTPFVMSAAQNLHVYDDNWEVLRDEYRELADECTTRAARVQAKLEQLERLDDGVSDSVVELAKTNALLNDFPTADMLVWSETVENKLGSRKE